MNHAFIPRRRLAAALVLAALVSGVLATRYTAPARTVSPFHGLYGAKLSKCEGNKRLQRGGFDLRVRGVTCSEAKTMVRRYSVHPADRLESVGSFGCYAYRPHDGPGAQRIICLDPARGAAFRWDIGG